MKDTPLSTPSVSQDRSDGPHLHLARTFHSTQCTLGILVIDGFVWRTLEPPWKDNRQNVSCIPPGTYPASFLKRSASGRYRNVFQIHEVPGRAAILIHAGNKPEHTKGCILIGKRTGHLEGAPAVFNSRSALSELKAHLSAQPFTLHIHGRDL